MIITNFAKLSVFIFLLIFSLTGVSYGSSALEIMTKVDARYTGDSAISDWRMILIDKKDRKRVREIEIFSKEYKIIISHREKQLSDRRTGQQDNC